MAKFLLAISLAVCGCDVVAEMGRDLEANGRFLTRLADQYNPSPPTDDVPLAISKASPALVTPPARVAMPDLGPLY